MLEGDSGEVRSTVECSIGEGTVMGLEGLFEETERGESGTFLGGLVNAESADSLSRFEGDKIGV
jgi:hypothetical protein